MDETRHPWGWSAERRARQSAAIHLWAPWTRSTGPVTEAGKRASPRNRAMPGTLRFELLMVRNEIAHALRLAKAVEARRRSRSRP